MDKGLRLIIWILVALVVISSFSTGWFFVAKEKLYSEYVDLQNIFKTTVDRLERELASSNKERDELRIKLAGAEKELKTLEARHKEVSTKYEALLKEKDELTREIAAVKKGKFYLEKKIKDMESDVFISSLLKERAGLEVELKKLKESLVPTNLKIEELKTENANLNSLLCAIKDEKTALEQRLKDSEAVAELLTRDLLKGKNEYEKDRREFENAKLENRLLKTRIAELEQAANRLDNLMAEKEDMRIKIANLERELEFKNREIEKFRDSLKRVQEMHEYRAEAYHSPQEVELPPIVLERSMPERADLSYKGLLNNRTEGPKGRIVTVNKEHNFVVIDLGRQNGIEIGTVLDVYRGDLLIGTLEAIQTRDRIAACDIKDVKNGFFVEVDDIVIKR